MSTMGLIPYCTSFAMFAAGRAYEQIRNSIAYVNANVKVACSHSGLCVGEDGGSHQTVEDIALMRVVPNMTILVPCDPIETRKAVKAAIDIKGPVYIRVARPVSDVYTEEDTPFIPGKANVMKDGSDVAIFATGLMIPEALKAADALEAKGISTAVVNFHTIKPFDTETALAYANKCKAVVTAEEHSIIGGLGGVTAETIAGKCSCKFDRVGIMDRFGQSGSPADLFKEYGLTAENIAAHAEALLK